MNVIRKPTCERNALMQMSEGAKSNKGKWHYISKQLPSECECVTRRPVGYEIFSLFLILEETLKTQLNERENVQNCSKTQNFNFQFFKKVLARKRIPLRKTALRDDLYGNI